MFNDDKLEKLQTSVDKLQATLAELVTITKSLVQLQSVQNQAIKAMVNDGGPVFTVTR